MSRTMANVLDQQIGSDWAMYNADCIPVLQSMPDASVHYSVFSPPYLSLYTYSASDRDVGNCASDDEFWKHFGFVIDELFRLVKPGRNVSVDCMNVPAMKERDGYIGIKDFRGDIIRAFVARGFVFHSEHCIRKDPLIEATRTKGIGLMHKQLVKDSAMCRAGLAQYLLTFRVPGENAEPIPHPNGIDPFIGMDEPEDGVTSHQRWRRYAEPIWTDINFQRTLNARAAREDADERHVCPMALDIIERALQLWTNPGEIVLSPFAGIGSEGYAAVDMGRRFIGVELKRSFYDQACINLASVEPNSKNKQLSLFESTPGGNQ